MTHAGSETRIDFNRSCVPLVEIVTEPDFNDSSEVRDYAKKLQQIFRYLGVSNADMERGDMRLEANVSVRPDGQTDLPPYRVELKNINSFRFMVAAIEYEIKRQIEALEKGEKLTQETRGWNEEKKETYLQRSKEEAHDYRYFPEPDLPELQVGSIKNDLPELPAQKLERFIKEYGLASADTRILIEDIELANFFEETAKLAISSNIPVKKVANLIINNKIDPKGPEPMDIIDDIVAGQIGAITDDAELEKLVKEAIEENPKAVEDYKTGKQSAIQALIGAVMKKTAGKADAGKVKEILGKLLRQQ